MSSVSGDFDPSSVRSTGQERKCGTCQNFIVKPPEVELAKYALPIGACAPGVHCLGGAVRGMCNAMGELAESTAMVPNTICGGKSYVPGGPTIRGMSPGSANRVEEKVASIPAQIYPFIVLLGLMAGKAIKSKIK